MLVVSVFYIWCKICTHGISKYGQLNITYTVKTPVDMLFLMGRNSKVFTSKLRHRQLKIVERRRINLLDEIFFCLP